MLQRVVPCDAMKMWDVTVLGLNCWRSVVISVHVPIREGSHDTGSSYVCTRPFFMDIVHWNIKGNVYFFSICFNPLESLFTDLASYKSRTVNVELPFVQPLTLNVITTG